MRSKVWAVVRAEWRRLPSRAGGRLAIGWYLAIVSLLGIYLPWRMGFEFLDSVVLLLYGCLSSLFVAPLIAHALGADRQAGLLDSRPAGPVDRAVLYGKVVSAATAGWCAALVVLLSGLLTVNLTGWHGRALLPPAAVLPSVAVWSLSLAALTAAAGARVALQSPTGASAARSLRFSILLLAFLYFLATRLVPGEWKAFFDSQMTPARLARNVAIVSPLLLLLSAALLPAPRKSDGAGNR